MMSSWLILFPKWIYTLIVRIYLKRLIHTFPRIDQHPTLLHLQLIAVEGEVDVVDRIAADGVVVRGALLIVERDAVDVVLTIGEMPEGQLDADRGGSCLGLTYLPEIEAGEVEVEGILVGVIPDFGVEEWRVPELPEASLGALIDNILSRLGLG